MRDEDDCLRLSLAASESVESPDASEVVSLEEWEEVAPSLSSFFCSAKLISSFLSSVLLAVAGKKGANLRKLNYIGLF